MKKLFILGLGAALSFSANAAPTIWNYNFGTGTGVHTSGTSVSFLPATETNGGTARVRVGTAGGSFNLENPGNASIGTGSELRMVAPTTTSVNKFSIFDFTTAETGFYTKFDIRLTGGSSGTFYFFAGNGASFGDNNGFTGSQMFTGIQWVFGASGAITTNVRSGSSWVTTGLPATPFSQDTTYTVEITGNNSASTVSYAGGAESVASNTWDLWIGGVKVGDNLAKAALANLATVDSMMFYSENSTGNVAQLIVDNLSYANFVVPEPSAALATVLGGAFLIGIRRKRNAA